MKITARKCPSPEYEQCDWEIRITNGIDGETTTGLWCEKSHLLVIAGKTIACIDSVDAIRKRLTITHQPVYGIV